MMETVAKIFLAFVVVYILIHLGYAFTYTY